MNGPMSKSKAKSKRYLINLAADRCKECGFCVEFCPQHLLCHSANTNSKGYHTVYLNTTRGECTGCDICTLICPDFAISVAGISGDEDNK